MEEDIDNWIKKQNKKTAKHGKTFVGERRYKHFDSCVSAQKFLSNSKFRKELLNYSALAKHKYLPFIRNDQYITKYEKATGLAWQKVKNRPIMYAAHRDAAIFSFYGYKLKKIYEERIKNTPLEYEVIAYREIPFCISGRNKSNIDFANEAFEFLHNYNGNATVLCLDIKSFFNMMAHEIIVKNLDDFVKDMELRKRLDLVLKPVMQYRYVFRKDVEKVFGKSHWNDIKKYNNIIRNTNLIHKNKSCKGIPQGSPISDILANIYLYAFDKSVSNYLDAINGSTFYRRYCDDIIIIVPDSAAKNIYAYVRKEIARCKLTLSSSKTEIFSADSSSRKLENVSKNYSKESTSKRKEIQYLGFSFDMDRIFIRSKSVENIYKKARVISRNSNKKTKKNRYHTKHKQEYSIYNYVKKIVGQTKNTNLNKQVKRIRRRTRRILRKNVR